MGRISGILVCLSGFALLGLGALAEPVAADDDAGVMFVPDEFIVMLTRDARGSIDVGADQAGRPTVNVPELQDVIDRHGVIHLGRQFPTAQPQPVGGKFRDLTGHYKVKIDNGVDLDTAMAAFARDPSVDHVEKIGIHLLHACATGTPSTPNDTCYAGPSLCFGVGLWGLWDDYGIDADLAWTYETGAESVVVVDMDTGVRYFHKDLGGNDPPGPADNVTDGNVWVNPYEIPGNGIDDEGNGKIDDVVGWDFVAGSPYLCDSVAGEDCDVQDNDPRDFQGHGTHTAGTMAAITNNASFVAGVAGGFGDGTTGSVGNGSKIMCLRMGWADIYGRGWVRMDYAAQAMNYVTDMKNRGVNVAAVNASWGSSNSGGIDAAVDNLLAADVMLIHAAGNDGCDCPGYLGNKAGVMNVAATRQNGDRAGWSNYGSWVDIAAPGVDIVSTYHWNLFPEFDDMARSSGTSMAAPHVAGVAALLESKNTSLTGPDKFSIMVNNGCTAGSPNIGDILNAKLALDASCTSPEECDDGNECTDDDCVGGLCENTPVPDYTVCTGGVCCGGLCTAIVCSSDTDCIDGDECTTDTCTDPGLCSASCSNTPVPDYSPCSVGGTVCCSGTCTNPACLADLDCDDGEECTTDTCTNVGTCSAFCENTWPACDPDAADTCCGPTCHSGNDFDCHCPDGTCDQTENQCDCSDDCGLPPENEVSESTCQDGVDNDCDGFADCDDAADCESDSACFCDDNGGNSPLVCVYWEGPVAPEAGSDFAFDFVTDPDNRDNPDVTFFTGNDGWRVWSQVSWTENIPANLGDIKIDPTLPTDNFSVTIAHGASDGAEDVASIALVDEGWTGESNLPGGSIAGDLLGDLVLQKSGGQGGVASFTIGGDLHEDVTIPRVDTLHVKGAVLPSAMITIDGMVGDKSLSFNVDAGDFAGDLHFPNGIQSWDAVVSIRGLLTDTASVDFHGQKLLGSLSFHGGSAEDSVIDVGGLMTGGTIWLFEDAYMGSVTVSSVELGGGITIAGADLSGSINVLGDWKGGLTLYAVNFAAEGLISIGGDLAATGSLYATEEGVLAGDILVNGTIAGYVTIDGVFNGDICAQNLSADAALPPSMDVVFGPDATICGESACPHDVDFDNGSSADRLIFVDADAPSPGNGSSWETAYTELETAVGQAAGADIAMEIWVAAGTYVPTNPGDPRSATFQLANGVLMYGGFAGTETRRCDRDPATSLTILSGDVDGDDEPDFVNNDENVYHVVTTGGTDWTAVLDGFIITGGNANASGGGMYNIGGSPTISRCVFRANSAFTGGGIWNIGGNPTLTNCLFTGNRATWSMGGGAIYSGGGSPTLTNCTFAGNSALSGNGGGMYNDQVSDIVSPPTLTNCILWGNSDSGPPDASAQIYNVIYPEFESRADIKYSAIQDDDPDDGIVYPCTSLPCGGTGNIDDDPEFVDPDGADDVVGTEDDDLHLYASSPCIEAGDNSVVTVATDLDGNQRILDADGVGGPTVDMGAYEFTCVAVAKPQAEMLGGALNSKNRYLSFLPGDSGVITALRVTFVDLPSPFDLWNGMQLFVGEPERICENSGQARAATSGPPPYGCGMAGSLPRKWFWAAPLECDSANAHFVDWHGWCNSGTCSGGLRHGDDCAVDDDCQEVIHLYNEGIVPSKYPDDPAIYDIQVIDEACSLDEDGNYSAPLTMTQARWGDVCGPGGGGACTAVPDGIVEVFNDVMGVLDKFANINGLQKAAADIGPGDDGNNNGPDLKVDAPVDVTQVLEAFQGNDYPYSPGDPCAPD